MGSYFGNDIHLLIENDIFSFSFFNSNEVNSVSFSISLPLSSQDVIQLLLSVVFLVVWVWSTYYDSTPSWIYFMDISLAIFFVLYWLLGLYLAEKRYKIE